MSAQEDNTAVNVKVWFKCRSCREYTVYFRSVEDFLDHKKDQHSNEFQKISCIVFEEQENTGLDSTSANANDLTCYEDLHSPVTVQEDNDVKSEFEPVSGDEDENDNLLPNSSLTETQTEDLLPDTAPGLSSLEIPTHSISDLPTTTRIFEANLNSPNLITLTIPRFIILKSESTTSLQNDIALPSPSPSPSLLPTKPKPSSKYIPTVRLQRLTPTEIKAKSSCSSSSAYLKRRPSFHSKKSSKVNKQPKSKKSKSTIVNSIRAKVYGPLVCEFCNKTFGHRSSLVLHLPVHSGDKPYKCSHPNCPLAFRIKNELTSHFRRNHTTKKTFFIFPKPKQQKSSLPLEEENDSMSLRDWLLKQKSTEPEEGHEKNFILLDPDPSVDPDPEIDLGPDLAPGPGTKTTEREPFIVSPENPIKCRLCAKKLKSEPEVKVHVTHCWFQNKKKHRYCIPCGKEMCNLVTYTQHTQKYHLNPNPPKIIDRSRYRHRNNEMGVPISSPNATPTERPVFYCEICARKFYSMTGLKRHGESHKAKEDQDRKYVCEFCGTDFLEMDSLRKHHVTHTNVRPFPCTFPDCGLAFKTEPVLRNHMNVHTNFKPFKCTLPDCPGPTSFNTKYKLQKHLLSRAHTGPTKNFPCEQDPEGCRKAYSQKAGLERHLLVAHGVGGELVQYECSVCIPVKTFNWKLAYDKHMMIHTGERPFKCSWVGCGKSYRHKNLLLDHERKHTGSQLFRCQICAKPFDKRVSLQCHLQTHNKL